VPEAAGALQVGFQLDTDEATTFRANFGADEARLWDKIETVVARAEPVEFGKGDQRSFIRPAHAWDSTGNRIPLDLEFRSEGGRLFLTKLIPVAWLRRAVFPVFADVDLTFGLPGAFNAASTNRMSVTPLDSTRVVIAFETPRTAPSAPRSWGRFGQDDQLRPRVGVQPCEHGGIRLRHHPRQQPRGDRLLTWARQDRDRGHSRGNTITFGPSTSSRAAAPLGIAATALDSTHVAIAYQDTSNGNFGTAIVGTISAETSSPSAPRTSSERN
jgi:hypothetical protein